MAGCSVFYRYTACGTGWVLEAAALLVTAWSLGNVFFQVPIGWIADRTSKRSTILACVVGTSICLLAMPFAIDSVWIWPLLLFAGAAGFGIYTVGLAELRICFGGSDLVAGTASFSSAFGFGALTGAVLCGFAMDAFGPHGFPGSILAVFLGYLVIHFTLRMRRRAAAVE